jgi:MFS family permease
MPNVQNDPLWNLRFALAGVGLALLLSVLIAAMLGGWLGDAVGGTYGWRAGIYSALLLYVVVGAFVLFAKVARHETRPLSAQRVGLWLASLWLWPGLLMVAKKKPPAEAAADAGAAPGNANAPRKLVPPTDPVMPPRDEPPRQ